MHRVPLFIFASLLLAVSTAAAIPPTPQPLSAEQRATFFGTAEDPPPEKLDATREDLEGRHYLSGDERNLHLFYPKIKGLGGGYMGVGSDQAYLFAGWMRADLVWLCDYDPWIRHLHHAYAAFFTAAETYEAFRDWWKPERDNVKKAVAHLEEHFKDHPDVRKIAFVYGRAAHKVYRRLKRLEGWLSKEKIPGFVNDAETYTFVRSLVTGGRVRPMLCNLLDDEGMRGAATAAKQLSVPIRVLYTSNAEQYWPYRAEFRQNIWDLHVDERSVIIRTVATKPTNDDYHYNVQPLLNFQEWLRRDWVRSVRMVVPYHPAKDEIPFTTVDQDPDEARASRDPKFRREQRRQQK